MPTNQTKFISFQSMFQKMMMGLTLMIIASMSISVGDTHISSSRNTYRSQICAFFSATYTSSDISNAQALINRYNYLQISDIEDIIFNRNFLKLNSNTLILVMPHLITFAIFCILWIPLCCCCVWPEKHPVCKKCRKSEKQNYQSCELKWTAYLTVIFYLVVLAGAVLAVIQGPDIVNYFNDFGCKTVSIGDDLIYGRISSNVENRFFVGLSPFSTDLASFQSNFNTIWTQSSSSLNTASNVQTLQFSFQTNINSTYTTYSNSIYTNAFALNGTTYQNVISAFQTLFYGPTSSSSTILGNIYSTTNIIFQQINLALNPMISSWLNLSTTTQSGVNTQMTTTITSITSLTNNINSFINNVGSFFNNNSLYSQSILALKAFYGCFFALAILGGVSAVLIACFSVVRVRLIMYFTCSFMYFLSFISFAMLIILSFVNPYISQVCTYMDTKLSSGAGTVYLFNKLGYSQMGAILKNCMADGNGWAMNQISPTFNISFSDIQTITQHAQLFNLLIPDYSTANLTNPFTTGTATVNKVLNAQLLDVTDTVATTFIDGVRLLAYPKTFCDTVAVSGDSWMPSFTLYSCPASKAQLSPCLNLASTSTCPQGCYQIMNQMESSSGDSSYSTTLQTRYGGNVNCTYYNYIKNLQLNWNVPRKAKMNTVKTSLNTLLSSINSYDSTFQGVQSSLSSFSTILQSNYDGQTNLITGSFNGLDCRTIAESITDFRNSLCVGLINSINFTITVLILLSYGSLLVACCGTCAGVRHFKHLQKMKIHTGYKGVPISISSQRLFDK